MKIADIINNVWFVGIVGGIISGIIVFFITKYFLEKKNKVEYQNKIAKANEAIGNYLRGYVVEIELPSNFIIEAVKNATAREYGVKEDELNSLKCICENLIQEIIGNVYVSNENKKMYIENLEKYMKENDDDNFDKIPEQIKGKFLSSRDEFFSGIIGTIIGLIGAVIPILIKFFM